MSVLSLAAASSIEMFKLVYDACPTALNYAAHDDVNPLCVAALKNDKELFFELINLGLNASKASKIFVSEKLNSSIMKSHLDELC